MVLNRIALSNENPMFFSISEKAGLQNWRWGRGEGGGTNKVASAPMVFVVCW